MNGLLEISAKNNLQNYSQPLGLCVRRGIWKMFSPELKPIKGTKVENIFYSSFMFHQLDMQPIVVLRMSIYSLPPADAKPRCQAHVCTFQHSF